MGCKMDERSSYELIFMDDEYFSGLLDFLKRCIETGNGRKEGDYFYKFAVLSKSDKDPFTTAQYLDNLVESGILYKDEDPHGLVRYKFRKNHFT